MEPLNYTVDKTRRFIRVIYQRQPRFEEWSRTMENIFADPHRRSGFGFLLDREWIFFPAESHYISKMVEYMDTHQLEDSPVRWAILTSDVGSFNMGLMAERITKNPGLVRVFQKRSEAEAWLTAPG